MGPFCVSGGWNGVFLAKRGMNGGWLGDVFRLRLFIAAGSFDGLGLASVRAL